LEYLYQDISLKYFIVNRNLSFSPVGTIYVPQEKTNIE